jgi:adenylate kinase family enzyme
VRMPRALCIRRVLERRVKYAGRTRAEMADDCPERVSLDFMKFIWNFERVEVPKIETVLREHGSGVPLIVLRKPAETAALLAAVDAVL